MLIIWDLARANFCRRCWYPDPKEGFIGVIVTSVKHEGDKYILAVKHEDSELAKVCFFFSISNELFIQNI